MDEKKLQVLFDRIEIIDVFNRYATGVDRRDPAIYRSCFTDELEVDLGGGGAAQMKADEWVERAFVLVASFQSTQHIITNQVININGDKATGMAYLQAQHFNPESMFAVGGYYENHLVRTPKGWRISNLKLNVTWTKNY